MGHAHDDFLDTRVGAVVDDGVEGRDDRLAALQRESLLADVFRVKEFLEELRLVHTAQDSHLLRPSEGRLQAGRFDAFLEPEPAVLVLDVRVFDSDMPAIGLLKRVDDVPELHLAPAEVGADVKGGVQVLGAELEEAQLQLWNRGRRVGQRVEVGLEVADGPVGGDDVVDMRLLEAVDDRGAGALGLQKAADRAAVAAEREALEERAPCRIDAIRVVEPDAIHRLDDVGVGARG